MLENNSHDPEIAPKFPETRTLFLSKATIAALLILVAGLLFLVVPTLFDLSEKWIGLSKQIANVLIPSGLIAAVYEFLLRRTFLKEMQEQLKEALLAAFGSVESLRSAGVIDIHSSLANDFLAKKFTNASRLIRILQTWMGNYTLIQDSLEVAAKAGRKIEILLLYPWSAQASARSHDLGWTSADDVSPRIEGDIKQLNLLCMENNLSNIELHLYYAAPIMTLYWYDEICYMGLFWRKKAAINKPQLEIRMSNSYFGDEIAAHFNDLWKNSVEIDLMKPIDFKALRANLDSAHSLKNKDENEKILKD
jgi:hypothetical protein